MPLGKIFEREDYDPGWLSVLTNPFRIARRGLARDLRALGSSLTGRTLDIGCGTKPYRGFLSAGDYVGLELDSPGNRATKNADRFYDGKSFPFADEEFDSVLTTEVLEHVPDAGQFLEEIRRVLKRGGKLLLTVPFVWDEHEKPHDYRRYTAAGLRAELERHGFTVLDQRRSVFGLEALVQLWICLVQKKLFTGNRRWSQLMVLIALSPLNLLGVVAGWISGSSGDFYLNNTVLAVRKD